MRFSIALILSAFLLFLPQYSRADNLSQILEINNFKNSDYAKLKFTPDLQLRREITEKYLATLKANGMNIDENAKATFLNPQVFEETGKALKVIGLDINNVADDYAFWWIDIWMAANKTDFTASPQQAIAVRKQAANLLARVPALLNANNAEKQKFADELVLQAIVLEGGLIRARNDNAFKNQLAQIAINNAHAASLAIERLDLTANGFVDKNGAIENAPSAAKEVASNTKLATNAPIYSKISQIIFYLWADMQFHPIVLFKDGQTYDLGDDALSKLNIEQSKITERKDWGLWNKTGDKYSLVDGANGKVSNYTRASSLYIAHAGQKNDRLNGEYKSVSSSLLPWYGEVRTMQARRLTFLPDGHFIEGNEFAGTGDGNISGVIIAQGGKNTRLGKYEINGHEIKLVFNNGVEKHMFFAFGSKGGNSVIDRDMVFIGRTAYVRQNRH